MFITGRTYDWWQSFPRNVKEHWDRLRRAFRERYFIEGRQPYETTDYLFNKKQESNESVEDYIAGDVNVALQMRKPEFNQRVLGDNPITVEKFTAWAKAIKI